MGYRMAVASAGNGGGTQVSDWTIIMDLLFTGASDRVWRGLLETDGRLTEDSDFFVNPSNQLGIGSYFGNVKSNTWHRIGIVVQGSTNKIFFYIDGAQVGSRDAGGIQAIDGRWA